MIFFKEIWEKAVKSNFSLKILALKSFTVKMIALPHNDVSLFYGNHIIINLRDNNMITPSLITTL